MQLASTTVVAAPSVAEAEVTPAVSLSVELPLSAPASNPALDGMWDCMAGDGRSGSLEFEINGNVLRQTVSNTSLVLAQGKGIDVGTQLHSYRDQETGQLMYVPVMTQVDKPGYASGFSPASTGGPEAGIELSLNPNDTISIIDYSSMAGAGSVGRPVPMTCRRVRG